VYAQGLPLPIEEEYAGIGHLSTYGAAKLAAEHTLWAEAMRANVPLTVLRPAPVWDGQSQFQKQVAQLVKGNNIYLPKQMGDNATLTTLAHLVTVVETLIGQPPVAGLPQTFNLADAAPYPLAQKIKEMAEGAVGHPLTIKYVPAGLLFVWMWLTGKHLSHSFKTLLAQPQVLNTQKIEQHLAISPA
jgi:nucleoside-diphosphate-sugar epimerase